jgi:hypothetical protein
MMTRRITIGAAWYLLGPEGFCPENVRMGAEQGVDLSAQDICTLA